jgi:hypothetical protein
MFEGFKLLKRQKHPTIHVMAGDTIAVTVHDEKTGAKIDTINHEITRSMAVNESVIFEGEFEGRRALGGLIVE